MYVYKPMNGHNLMQAIARVNRVFQTEDGEKKEGGLIVDYVGIAQALKNAMQQYTNRDRRRFGDPDIAKTAKVKWKEEMEICRDQLHGFDYHGFFEQDNVKRASAITGGANFLSSPAMVQRKKDFMEHTGKTATPEIAQNVHHGIREFLKTFNAEVADGVRILYGGSCNAKNAADIFAQPDVDGGLIGGASLKAPDFTAIIEAAAKA